MDAVWMILKGLLVLIQVILVFNLLIVVHEWGHFLAARWRGLKIEKFQIWFGKCVWQKRINGVQYGLGTIPAGGFVALPQMAPMERIEGREGNLKGESLPPISPLDKIIVAAAGPLFSILLAFFFATIVWLVGHPENVIRSTVIGYVAPDSPAEKAGLLPGDEVVSINGHEVTEFLGILDSITERVSMSKGEVIRVGFRRPGVEGVQFADSGFEIDKGGITKRAGFRRIGIGPFSRLVVAETMEYSPARLAGIRPGEEILRVNGERVYSTHALAAITTKGEAMLLELASETSSDTRVVELVPTRPVQPDGRDPMLGIRWERTAMDSGMAHPTPWEQVHTSSRLIWRTIQAVASPKTDVGIQHLSGPVGIGEHYFHFLRAPDGWRQVFWFSVILNVNLAIMNMLPFPVLDGGHITMALAELVRRKPMNARFLEALQATCAFALISFLLFVSWFDGADAARGVGSSLSKRTDENSLPVRFAPPEGTQLAD